MTTAAMVLALIAIACVVAAPVFDLMRFEIPDMLSIVIVVAAVLYGLITPGFNWLSHLASTGLVFLVGLLLFARNWMGGGDVKLLTAIAAWTGLQGLLLQIVATSLAGGILALVLIVARRSFLALGTERERVPRVFQHDAPLPYGVAIAAGTLWWAVAAWPIL